MGVNNTEEMLYSQKMKFKIKDYKQGHLKKLKFLEIVCSKTREIKLVLNWND